MSERILNKKLSKASGVILIRGGEIIDFFPETTVVEDRETGRSRGFGFVEMSSKEEGENAIAELNGKEFNGRNLTVNEAKPREDRGGGGRNRGGGRGGYGGGNNREDRGSRAGQKGSFDKVKNPNEEAELNILFTDFTRKKQAHYRKIDASQKEIQKLNAKSAKRQKRFEAAMQKLEGMLK